MRLTHDVNVKGVDLTIECLHTLDPVTRVEKLVVAIAQDDAPYSSQTVIVRHRDGEGKEF